MIPVRNVRQTDLMRLAGAFLDIVVIVTAEEALLSACFITMLRHR
ncbi:MAG: hypothetical protein ACK50J_15020 [Planctomyces sp.]